MKSGEGKAMLVLCERINQTSQGRIWQSPAPRFGGMLRRCEVLIVLSGTAMPSFCPREGFYTSLAFPIIREMYAMGRKFWRAANEVGESCCAAGLWGVSLVLSLIPGILWEMLQE